MEEGITGQGCRAQLGPWLLSMGTLSHGPATCCGPYRHQHWSQDISERQMLMPAGRQADQGWD